MAASDLNLLEQNNRASHSTTPGSIDEKSLYHSLTRIKANVITPSMRKWVGVKWVLLFFRWQGFSSGPSEPLSAPQIAVHSERSQNVLVLLALTASADKDRLP